MKPLKSIFHKCVSFLAGGRRGFRIYMRLRSLVSWKPFLVCGGSRMQNVCEATSLSQCLSFTPTFTRSPYDTRFLEVFSCLYPLVSTRTCSMSVSSLSVRFPVGFPQGKGGGGCDTGEGARPRPAVVRGQRLPAEKAREQAGVPRAREGVPGDGPG